MRVAIVGGGIAGLCAAWELAKAGAEVTVVEKGEAGGATSRGNAGWVVPALTAPLSAPGSVRQGMRLMLKRDNPFYIQPRPSPRLARWLFDFWRSSAPARFSENVRAIYALGERTLEQFDDLAADGVEFEMEGGGLIFLCLSEPSLTGTMKRVEQLARLGYAGEVELLDRATLVAREPSVGQAVVGGVHLKDVRRVRPESLSTGLAAALRARRVQLLEHTPVEGIVANGRTWHIRVKEGSIAAEQVVLAAGIWTNGLLRSLGGRLSMEAGKGYSLTADGDGLAPVHAVHMVEPMVGVSPFAGGVRLAGMVELAGPDPSVRPRRIASIVRAAAQFFDTWRPERRQLEWAGLRPLTPDGLPYLGAVPGRSGLFVCTGGGMTGLTIAPAAGAALASVITGRAQTSTLHPFRPDRF